MNAWDVLKRPLITEKGTDRQAQLNQYTFAVSPDANKNQIKEAVQLAFNVRVTDVNTMKVKGKPKRFGRKVTLRPDWKKAIVTLVSGDKIELFEGI